MPAWRHTFDLQMPQRIPHLESDRLATNGQFVSANLKIKPRDSSVPILATYWAPPKLLVSPVPKVVVLIQPDNAPMAKEQSGTPAGLPLALLNRGIGVIQINSHPAAECPDQFTNFYTTYNLTRLQQRVRDLLNTCAVAQAADPRDHRTFRVVLLGTGVAGLWALLASPAADAVVADANYMDLSDDQTLLGPDLFTPGLRNIGSFEGAALLAAPHPLLIHHTGKRFSTSHTRSAYKSLGAINRLRIEPANLTDDLLAKWIIEL